VVRQVFRAPLDDRDRAKGLNADDGVNVALVIAALGLAPYPEVGHYRESYRRQVGAGERGAATSIYYLLRAGEVSHWHRLRDADEIWSFHAGGALTLSLSPDGKSATTYRLGVELAQGECPQLIVPNGCWQSARTLGDWTFVGCMVAPAFAFAGLEMAPPGWKPA